MINLADTAEFFRDKDDVAYATIPIGGHRETWPLRSKNFRKWLGHKFYQQENKPASSQAFSDALALIAARAQFQGSVKDVYTRIAVLDDQVIVDLCNDRWEVVEITSAGYRVLPESPVKFRRAKGMKSLPHPVAGSLRDIKDFLNVKAETDWSLMGAWMIGAFSQGPYPVIILLGEQGTGKSVISRMLKSIVDPATSPLRSIPRNPRDLMIAGKNGWVIAFDNLSGMPAWLSDAICRLSTGGGFSTRELFTDDGEALFNATRPVILNGISDVASRHDLIDRALMINLEMIPEEQRKPEKEIWNAFDQIKPRILGGLFDAVSSGIRNQNNVSFERLPRMADFAIWAAAAEKECQWSKGITFMDAYQGNRSAAVEMAVDADLVASSIMKLLLFDGGKWQGTATELLDRLTDLVPDQAQKTKSWPKQPNRLSGKVRRAATFLRTLGVNIIFPGPNKGNREFIISVNESRPKEAENDQIKSKRPDKNNSSGQLIWSENTTENQVVRENVPERPDGPDQLHTHSKKGVLKNSMGSENIDEAQMVVVNI